MKYTISALVGSAALASAHGFVDTAVIGGETFEFYDPYSDAYSSPVPERISRSIPDNGPVRDASSSAMTCGADSEPAALHAQAAAGSTVELTWTLWPESHVGPVLTYMARCPDAGCQDYQPGSDAVWFKIQEGGREGVTDNWAATPVMTEGGSVDYTIPECLSPGYYLVRHEIIALHQEAEYYPGCHQLEVTGSGSTVPSADLVSFPGAYSSSDPGIDYNSHQNTEEYIIPGPALFTCSGAGNGGAGNGGTNSTLPVPPPVSYPVPVPSDPTGLEPVATSDLPSSATPSPILEPVDPVDEDDGDEDDCPVDDGSDDDEDDEDDEDDVIDDNDDEDDQDEADDEDCPADEEDDVADDVDDVDDEDCPAEDEEDIDDDDDLEDEDDAEDDEEADDDEQDCEPVTPTKRQSLHERRLNKN